MRKITAYRVISSRDKNDFVEKVNFYIGLGWQPINGTFMSNDDSTYREYNQTLVMYEE